MYVPHHSRLVAAEGCCLEYCLLRDSCRGLTVSQASRLMRLYRLQAVQRPTWALASSRGMYGSDSNSQAGQQQMAVTSHPISVSTAGAVLLINWLQLCVKGS
jgi:hypothetical protein